MDPNYLYTVCSTIDNKYVVYGLDISTGLTYDFKGPIHHPFPDPVLTLPIASTSISFKNQQHGDCYYPSQMAFASLGSKLYMIGGFINYNTPSLNVYIFDITNNHSLTKGPPLTFHKGENPIVIPIGNKLYVLPKSLGPDASAIIEVLDTTTPESSWVTLTLPPELVELSYMPFTVSQHGEVVTTCRREFRDYDPFEIISYGTKGSQLLLSLSMCVMMKCGDLAFDVHTHKWRLPSLNTPSQLPYPTPFFTGSVCCDTYSDTSYVHFNDINNGLHELIPIPSPVPIAANIVLKHGDNQLVAFSWSRDSSVYWRQIGTYFRVDVLVVVRHKDRSSKKDIQTALFVKSKIYQLISGAKLSRVHYCYLISQGK